MTGISLAAGEGGAALVDARSQRARAWKSYRNFACSIAWVLLAASLVSPAFGSRQQPQEIARKAKSRGVSWNPPKVDGPLKSLTPASSCDLSQVLKKASARAEEMEENLANFTADETIQYQLIGSSGALPVYRSGTFEYLAVLTPTQWGASVQETRTPTKGTRPFAASGWDRGLPGLALIFLPKLQSGYEMRCEGETEWAGRAAWVIHFRQRADAPPRTFSYVDSSGSVDVAKLEGRAWVAADSGEVVHLETALLQGVPGMDVRSAWFLIDYEPVQFHSRNVRIWLPQDVASYTEFDDINRHRMVIEHTFRNFMLFSVRVKQEIQKPGKMKGVRRERGRGIS